jgi:hypothetical protein
MNDVTPQRRRPGSPLVAGIILIVLGALLLALNLGLRFPLSLFDYWPMALIVPGIVAVTMPSRHLSRSGGIWLVATGLYCEIGLTGWFGLGWFSAWPIFIIAYGLDVIFESRGTSRDDPVPGDSGQPNPDADRPGPDHGGSGQGAAR